MLGLAHLLLALVVALASVTMAQARHQARASGEVVLCTGIGMIAVAVDARGNPVGPMVPCPECTPALAALDVGGAPVSGPSLRLLPAAVSVGRAPAVLPAPPRHRNARAPPAPV
jgi:hypothetical protein